MNTPLSFPVTVTECRNCPYANQNAQCCTKHPVIDQESSVAAYRIYMQNKTHLTPSCPMIKTKEGETK